MKPPTGVPSHYVQISENHWADPSRLVGGLPTQKPKQDSLPALDNCKKARSGSKRGVAVRVSLIRVGKRILDDDNLASSFKGLRDGIAEYLCIDDADPKIKWEYGQFETKGRCGCIVKIECV